MTARHWYWLFIVLGSITAGLRFDGTDYWFAMLVFVMGGFCGMAYAGSNDGRTA